MRNPIEQEQNMRSAVNSMTEDERENLIQKLGVSHLNFNNWLNEKYKLGNSKQRNKLIHLLAETGN